MKAAVRCLALLLICAGCTPSPEETQADVANVTNFLGTGAAADGFERALVTRPFSFPADHGPHPGFRTEWWYLTGNLATAEQRHFGFQLTFFRFALATEPAERASAWAADQLWMAHFTVTDTAAERFYAAEKFERQALGLAGAQAAPFRVWLADWELAAEGEELFPLDLTARGADASLSLSVAAGKPHVLQGDKGLDPKGPAPGNASYYYSFTRLPAVGRVEIGDQAYAVSGNVWLDREWSTSVLPPDVEGWDWFALQLDDGSDLMVYRLRRRDQTASPFSNGILVERDGTVTQRFGAEDFSLTPTGQWRSPQTGVRYNVEWRLSVPAHELELALKPQIANQELDLTVRYWEGAMIAAGTRAGQPVSGVGYTEMVGVGTGR